MKKRKRNKKKNKKAIKKTKVDWVQVTGWKSKFKSMQNLLDYLHYTRSGSNETRIAYCYLINAFCMFLYLNPDQLLELNIKKIEYHAKTFLAQWSGKTANNYMYALKTFFRENRIVNIKFHYA